MCKNSKKNTETIEKPSKVSKNSKKLSIIRKTVENCKKPSKMSKKQKSRKTVRKPPKMSKNSQNTVNNVEKP